MPDTKEAIIGNLGVLILDVQEVFLKTFAEPRKFVRRVALTVETARLFGLPALLTEQRPDVLGTTTEPLLELALEAPRVAKTGFSAFTEKAVLDWIHQHDLKHILIAGLETPICVYQTAIDAIHEELEVTLLSDAVCGRRPADGNEAMRSLRIQGVHVLPSETVFYSILRDSTHALFRDFTRLVKKYSD